MARTTAGVSAEAPSPKGSHRRGRFRGSACRKTEPVAAQNRDQRVLCRNSAIPHPSRMATLAEKVAAEHHTRKMLAENGLPEPDEVQYGHTCIRLLWHDQKLCVVVDIDDLGDELAFAEDLDPEASSSE
jgi:hypothetical protein